MAESSVPSLGDLMGIFGGANPLASIGKTIEQFKRGVSDFLTAVENFNKTMETVNGIATRANALFDEIEEPIRAFMPQVTRSIKAADAVINQISGPIEKVAPGISRLAETLGNPVFTSMPTDIAGFLDTLGDVARRLQPLAQLAENAGGLFGLRQFGSLLGGGSSQPSTPPPPPPPPRAFSASLVTAGSAARKVAPRPAAAAKKSVAKKSAPAKAAAAKKPAAKAGATTKPATKKPATKKPATKKPATKKPAAK